MKIKHLLLIIAVVALAVLIYLYFRNSDEVFWNDTAADIKKTVITGPPKDPFKSPVGVFVDSRERIFVADSDNHRVRIFSPGGKLIRQFGGFGTVDGKLGYPVAAAVNSAGEVYVSEVFNNRVQVMSERGEFLRWFPSIRTELKAPSALYIDEDDLVYVFDRGDHRFKVFDRAGKLLRTIGGGSGAGERLRFAMGIAPWRDGSLLVSDSGNRGIKIFDAKGRLTEQLLKSTKGIPPLGLPRGIAVINENKFAVVDSFSRKVYLISKNGDGWKNQALDHLFYLPDGAFYRKNKLYVTDRSSNSIVVFENIR